MADKTIGELQPAPSNLTSYSGQELFVLEQDGTAKKLTMQILENWLTSKADGHGGVQDFELVSTSGRNKTYQFTMADETTFQFTVVDGEKGDTGDQTYVHFKWAAEEPTADNQMSNNPDAWIGIYAGTASTAPTTYTSYTWYEYKGETGDAASLADTDVEYQGSDSGTVVPTGSWETVMPSVRPGWYLWTRTTLTFNSGSPVVFYSATRQGIDGAGSPGTQTPLSNTAGGAVGTSDSFSRQDHQHPLQTAGETPAADSVSVQSHINTIEANIKSLEISPGLKTLLIGDSYAYGTGGTEGHGWAYYFTQETGVDSTIVNQQGGGFAAVGNTNATYPNVNLAGCVDVMSESDNYRLIVAQAGWNDASTGRNPTGVSAIVTGVDSFITKARAKWPEAVIVVIPTLNDTFITPYQTSCLRAIARTAFNRGVRSSERSFYWMQGSGFNATDNIHLNDSGYQMLGEYIVSFVRGWDGWTRYRRTLSFETPTVSGVTLGNNAVAWCDENWGHFEGDVTLTGAISSQVTVATGLAPGAVPNTIRVFSQWGTSFTRNLRGWITDTGNLILVYGAAGSYRLEFHYPLAHP